MEKNLNSDVPVCESHHLHSEQVEEAVKCMPDEEKLLSLGEFYKVFGEVSRLKILYLLFDRELCVCDIAESLSSTVSAVSHQLKILKNARLVKFRKDGKNCYYSLADTHISGILYQGMEHINE
ncbi:MAG: helix-turn-helix transcriptional regulator [Ruminococcaceae bacterium]|nr:helix-turn-helix transcriptional regulator [Oscillospiraceae bacterium]